MQNFANLKQSRKGQTNENTSRSSNNRKKIILIAFIDTHIQKMTIVSHIQIHKNWKIVIILPYSNGFDDLER